MGETASVIGLARVTVDHPETLRGSVAWARLVARLIHVFTRDSVEAVQFCFEPFVGYRAQVVPWKKIKRAVTSFAGPAGKRRQRVGIVKSERQLQFRPPLKRSRSRFANKPLSKKERAVSRETANDRAAPPISYPDCADSPAPCWKASCRHSLLIEVNEIGSLKENFPGWDVTNHYETCSLREARKGRRSHRRIGKVMNLTDEQVRYHLKQAFEKIRESEMGREWMEAAGLVQIRRRT